MLHIQRLFIFVVIMFPLLSSILILDHTTQTLPILSPPNEYLESRLSFIVHRFGHSLPSIYEPFSVYSCANSHLSSCCPLISFSLVSELHVSFLFMSPRPLRAFLILNDYSPCFFSFTDPSSFPLCFLCRLSFPSPLPDYRCGSDFLSADLSKHKRDKEEKSEDTEGEELNIRYYKLLFKHCLNTN